MSDTKLTGADLEQALSDRGLPSVGTADEKRTAIAEHDEQHANASTEAPSTTTGVQATRLDDDVTKPSVTKPGDGPADTTDPTEVAHSVPARPGAEAIAAGTVNTVLPGQRPIKPPRDESKDRFEEYEAFLPDNRTKVRVRRNLETGESAVISA